MIDYVKFGVHGESFHQLKKLDFKYELSPETGDMAIYTSNGYKCATKGVYKHKDLTITYIKGKHEHITLSGSLPKYYSDDCVNHTDYTFTDFKSTIKKLKYELNVNANTG